jgi:hypothetical protein
MRVQGFLKSIIILAIAIGSWFSVNSCYAQSLSSRELIDNAKKYDTGRVTFEGEVIGDVMCRGQYCWVNINDGKAAIGVWMPKDYAQKINYRGSYKQRGDWLRINGIFNRACPQHSGQLDIHAQEVEQIKKGKIIRENFSLKRRNLTVVLLGALCIVWIFSRLKTS